MSLINTMLKDLELHRHSQKPAREVPSDEQAPLPIPEPRRWLSISALVQATLTVLVAGGVASWVSRQAPMGPMMPLEPAGPVAKASPPMASEPVAHAPLPQPQPVRLEPALPTPATPATPAREEPPATPMPPVVPVVPVVPALHSADRVAKALPEPAAAPVVKKAPAIAAPVQAPAQNPNAQRPPEAKPTAQPAAPAPPPREMLAAQADKLYTQALEHQKQGQAEQAMASLQASLAANPKQVQARLLLASMLAQRKQAGPAADLLTDGLMLLPQQTAFMRELAPLWITAGQQDDAMALLAQGAKMAGNSDPGFHGYYASQLLRLKRPSEAQTHYRLALTGNPEQAEWLVGLGLALQQQGSAAEALEAFRRASASGKLSPQVQAMVNQMIAKLQTQNP